MLWLTCQFVLKNCDGMKNLMSESVIAFWLVTSGGGTKRPKERVEGVAVEWWDDACNWATRNNLETNKTRDNGARRTFWMYSSIYPYHKAATFSKSIIHCWSGWFLFTPLVDRLVFFCKTRSSVWLPMFAMWRSMRLAILVNRVFSVVEFEPALFE